MWQRIISSTISQPAPHESSRRRPKIGGYLYGERNPSWHTKNESKMISRFLSRKTGLQTTVPRRNQVLPHRLATTFTAHKTKKQADTRFTLTQYTYSVVRKEGRMSTLAVPKTHTLWPFDERQLYQFVLPRVFSTSLVILPLYMVLHSL